MRWAYYSIQRNGPSFDFLTFMQAALYRGANGIWVEDGKCGWPGYGGYDGEQRRIETILKPIVRMYGLEFYLSPTGPSECVYPVHPAKVAGVHKIRNVRNQPRIYPLMPPKEALDKAWDAMGGRKRIVLAARECKYEMARNTTEGQMRWAADNDVFVLRDNSVSLEERVAYYEHAKFVIGNNSGIMTPVIFSHRPFMMMRMLVEGCKATMKNWYEDNGLKVGFQYPWTGIHQRILWEHNDDSYEGINAAYQYYLGLNDQRLS